MNRSVLLALVAPHHGFFKGVARYASEAGWHLNTFMAYSGKIPLGWDGDGIVSFCGYSSPLVAFIQNANLPTVEISEVRDDLGIPFVSGDNYAIGKLGAEYFLERNFKHFVWAPLAHDTPNQKRCQGFTDTVEKAGFSVTKLPPLMNNFHDESIDWPAIRGRMRDALKLIPIPAAIFAYNDSVGADVMNVCLKLGLLVPEQVAILGVDNDEIVSQTAPIPQSSVLYDAEELGYQGAKLLDDLLDGQPIESRHGIVKPHGIIDRQSTDILAVENVKVAKALRYLWAHHDNPLLSVEDIAGSVCVSSRYLRRAFTHAFGRSVRQELMRYRLERVKELLLTSSMSATQIASVTGFSSATYLFRFFKQQLNTSPKQFRIDQGVNRNR